MDFTQTIHSDFKEATMLGHKGLEFRGRGNVTKSIVKVSKILVPFEIS